MTNDTPTIDEMAESVEVEARAWEATARNTNHPETVVPRAAALRAAAETLRGMQWRDIESAPKDGSWVRLAMSCRNQCTARWDAGKPEIGIEGKWKAKCNASHVMWPTHWQPLPLPPTEKDGK